MVYLQYSLHHISQLALTRAHGTDSIPFGKGVSTPCCTKVSDLVSASTGCDQQHPDDESKWNPEKEHQTQCVSIIVHGEEP
jgi:hypothetical protein